jgi:hypothetical protein
MHNNTFCGKLLDAVSVCILFINDFSVHFIKYRLIYTEEYKKKLRNTRSCHVDSLRVFENIFRRKRNEVIRGWRKLHNELHDLQVTVRHILLRPAHQGR